MRRGWVRAGDAVAVLPTGVCPATRAAAAGKAGGASARSAAGFARAAAHAAAARPCARRRTARFGSSAIRRAGAAAAAAAGARMVLLSAASAARAREARTGATRQRERHRRGQSRKDANPAHAIHNPSTLPAETRTRVICVVLCLHPASGIVQSMSPGFMGMSHNFVNSAPSNRNRRATSARARRMP